MTLYRPFAHIITALSFFIVLFTTNSWAVDKIYTNSLNNNAISGYDAVAYFTQQKSVQGKIEFSTNYEGATWLFATQKHLNLFLTDPTKYAPQYGGYCAYAASQGAAASTLPDNWTINNGKLYLNYNTPTQELWQSNMNLFIKQANEKWPTILQQ